MRAAGSFLRLAQERRNQETLRRQHDFRILCLGESTTAGETRYGRYPSMLEDILNLQDLPGRVAVVNKGRSGADTNDIVLQLERDLDEIEPDLAVVMMGINDAGRTHAYGSIIEPGARHWYGSFRLYKLYRVLRHMVVYGRIEAEPADPLIVGDGIVRVGDSPVMTPSAAGGESSTEDPYATGELPAELRKRIGQEDYEAAERMLTELLEADPSVPVAYVELAQIYERTERPEDSRATLLRGVSTIPRSVALRAALAHSYETTEEWERAIATVRYIIGFLLRTSDLDGHTHYRTVLADLYERSGRYDLAERELLDVVQRLNPGDDVVYQRLIDFYERRGEAALAEAHRDVQRRIRYEYVNPDTRAHYETLRDILRARGIPLLAVQYPIRPIASLRRMLGNDPAVIYVDNGGFRERVEAEGYEAYFHDHFAGDFGHLTRRGNELLAENVARAIVERYFGIDFRLEVATK